ncbi:type II secretion system protein [Vibrio cholerae]|uniref:type II secretion system protein n=1 Tax=Vibrio cholerae TaxID=666 RepID=UPI003080ADB2
MTIKKYRKGSTGFTLLEMLVVLAIIGSVSVVMVRQHQRDAEAAVIRATADAMADEMLDLARLAQKTELKLTSGSKQNNPMYSTSNGSSPQAKRSDNFAIESDFDISKLYNWKSATDGRVLFTEFRCKTNGSTVGLPNLSEEFLSCTLPKLADNAFQLNYVGVVGTHDHIQRIDYYWEYVPDSNDKNRYAKLLSFIEPIEKSFANREAGKPKFSLILNDPADNKWRFAITGTQNSPIFINDGTGYALEHLLWSAGQSFNKTRKYGVRVSVDIWSGEYLKADGSVRTEKLCWNAQTGQQGPCFYTASTADTTAIELRSDGNDRTTSLCWSAGSNKPTLCLKNEGNDNSRFLELKQKDGNGQESTGTLVANVINRQKLMGNNKIVYSTNPIVSYEVFNNSRQLELDLLECPMNPETKDGSKLSNKISVSLASFAADVERGINFTTLDKGTTHNTPRDLHRTAGVFVSAKEQNGKWIIEANNVSHRVTDGNQTGINSDNAKNPDSVALIVQRWCSN